MRSRSPHGEQLRNLCSMENETEIKDASKTLVIVSLTVGLYLYMINRIKGKADIRLREPLDSTASSRATTFALSRISYSKS